MKTFKLMLHSLLLSLALAGTAMAADPGSSPGQALAEKVNVNTADAATIDRVLVNVGPSKAQAIVDYRKQNGAFKSVEQLASVKGIGLKTVEKNRDRIVLGAPAATSRPAAHPAVARR